MAGLGDAKLRPHLIDYRESGHAPWQELETLVLENRVRALVAMNGVGFPYGGHELLAQRGVTIFVLGMDHPCHLFPLMEAAPPGTCISFPTASNLDFAHRYMRDDLRYLHIPHGAAARLPRAWDERDIDVLMIGNLRRDSRACAANWASRGPEAPVLEIMREMYLTEGAETLEGLGERALAATGNDTVPLAQPAGFARLLRDFDPYARSLLREIILTELTGLPVLVVGEWPDATTNRHDSHVFTGPQDAGTVADMVGRAKIIINVVPAYYRSHERIFDAMAAGAVSISMAPTDFADLDSMHGVLSVDDPSDMGQLIAALLADDGDLGERGRAAAALAAKHRWTDRFQIAEDAIFIN